MGLNRERRRFKYISRDGEIASDDDGGRDGEGGSDDESDADRDDGCDDDLDDSLDDSLDGSLDDDAGADGAGASDESGSDGLDTEDAEGVQFCGTVAEGKSFVPPLPVDSGYIVLQILAREAQGCACFKLKRTTALGQLLRAYCKRVGISDPWNAAACFYADGEIVSESDTPESLKMENDDIIDVVLK